MAAAEATDAAQSAGASVGATSSVLILHVPPDVAIIGYATSSSPLGATAVRSAVGRSAEVRDGSL
jgi:hypothetical protein